MKRKLKEIYCPECARVIYRYDGKHTLDIIKKCECGAYVKYDPQRNVATRISKPVRQSSSGTRFW